MNGFIRSEIQRVYKDIANKPMDSKTVTLWENSIRTKEKSLEDLQESLLGSVEYKTHVSNMFKTIYYDIIGFDLSPSVIKTFLNENVNVIVSKKSIRDFIIQLPAYHEKYRNIVQKIYLKTVTDENQNSVMPKEHVDFYIAKLQNNENYDIDCIYNDMINNVHAQVIPLTSASASASASNYNEENDNVNENEELKIKEKVNEDLDTLIAEAYRESGIEAPSSDDVDKIKNLMRQPSQIIQLLQKEKEKELKIDEENINNFERVFKRPMYTQEYFKYVLNNTHPINFTKIYDAFYHNYNTLRNIRKDYLNENFDEYVCIREYIDQFDNPDFLNTIVDTLIEWDAYKSKMCEQVQNNYRHLFQETLEQNDVEYVFNKIKAEKLSLFDERVNEILIELKTETDDIISKIFVQFMKVLERPPDTYEILEYIQIYRSLGYGTMENVDLQTELNLIKTLEFQDILKKKLKQKIPKIMPRVLFKYLEQLIKGINEESGVDSLMQKIDKFAEKEEN